MDRPGGTVPVARKRGRRRAGHSTSVRYTARHLSFLCGGGGVSIQEARQLIADADASMMARIEASRVLSLSDDATIMDLVDCLRCRGVIAELAAVGLYRRTGR